MIRTLVIAGIVTLIPLIGNVVASFLTTWTGAMSWLVGPTVAVMVAMASALIQAHSSASPTPPPTTPSPGQPSIAGVRLDGSGRRGVPLAAAILIILLVIGVGGFGLTLVVRNAIGYITGNEPGTDRLVRPATVTDESLTLTVNGVIYTDHFTRLEVAAQNDTGSSVTLPLFGYCVFVGRDGTTLEPDSSRSNWSNTVAPGGIQRGTITFPGHLPESVRRARFGFTTVFGMGFGGPDDIFVDEIRLRRASFAD